MKQNAIVTGADRGLGLAICAGLLEQNWQVFAGLYLPEWHELTDLRNQISGSAAHHLVGCGIDRICPVCCSSGRFTSRPYRLAN